VNRRGFLKNFAAFSAGGMLVSNSTLDVRLANKKKPNILLLTADDMSYESLGLTGCSLAGLSPNIDQFATEGIFFEHAHIVTAICGPSRGAFHTGRYPHSTGSMGHGDQPPSWWQQTKAIPSISKYLHDNGYFTGLMCKGAGRAIEHVFDFNKSSRDTDAGRGPAKFYSHSRDFFDMAKRNDQPFFFNVNMRDPHKPWARQESDNWVAKERANAEENGLTINIPDPKTHYSPEEIPMPPYLIDTPDVREDIAPYFDSVNRMDECFGQVIRALKEAGLDENTMIVFLADHGIGTAFAKRSNYFAGTRTPLIISWPGKITPGRVDSTHVISTVDLVPTFLEAVDLPPLEGIEGRSLMPILMGKKPKNWRTKAYSAFNCMNGEEEYWPSRAMSGARYVYVWNSWVDGVLLSSEVIHGGGGDFEQLARRRWADDWEHGVTEEFYDMQADPGFWDNLIDSPQHQSTIDQFRQSLLSEMKATNDPELQKFQQMLNS
jgi:N-sulfoglucosamine sulfohydrolase